METIFHFRLCLILITLSPQNSLVQLNPPGFQNVVLFNNKLIDQSLISLVSKKYSRMRDYYNDPPLYGPVVQVGNLVAAAVNSTLKAASGAQWKDSRYSPTILALRLTDIANGFLMRRRLNQTPHVNPKEISKIKGDTSQASLSQVEVSLLNFVYCSDTRVAKFQRTTFFNTLTGKIDKFIWICLIVAIPTISVLTSISLQGNKWQISVTLTTTLSVLLTPGVTYYTRLKNVEKSWNSAQKMLFVLWMLCCTVFITYYSGDLTSTIIRPPVELHIRKFQHLLDYNFSISYQSLDRKIIVASFVESSLKCENKINLECKVRKLIMSADLATSRENFIGALVTGNRIASIVPWSVAIYGANKGNEWIVRNKILNRRCYIGEELRYPSNLFYVFVGTQNGKLKRKFQTLLEKGFYSFWWKEHVGIATSERVQSRVRLLSRTHLQEDTDKPKSLELDGKIEDVFCLWLIFLGGSGIALVLEIFNARKHLHKM